MGSTGARLVPVINGSGGTAGGSGTGGTGGQGPICASYVCATQVTSRWAWTAQRSASAIP